ncbi:hypothetical protein [Fortiea contorta]|uniref:hypothetical protein n=1 Tax=Fortiea contorta TaxID=1892405 RepID=UPI0003736DFA|nr:hypothetical protein [Fortiea contorta]
MAWVFSTRMLLLSYSLRFGNWELGDGECGGCGVMGGGDGGGLKRQALSLKREPLNLQGATIASKSCKLKVWEAQTPGKICVLIENELYSY